MTELLSLSEIAEREQCDKSPSYHNYTAIYSRFFDPFRAAPINIFEIGVFQGKSMRVWHQYFARAQIFGLDIDPLCKQHEFDRIRIVIGSQSDPRALVKVLDLMAGIFPFVIIDDGSHASSDIIASLHFLHEFIPFGGYYFIEDLYGPKGMAAVKEFVSGLLVEDPGLELVGYFLSEARTDEELCVLRRKR